MSSDYHKRMFAVVADIYPELEPRLTEAYESAIGDKASAAVSEERG